jgi:hypothetical protein
MGTALDRFLRCNAGVPMSPVIENGAEVLDLVEAHLSRFISYPSTETKIAHVLWIAHTHRMDKWDTTPRIAFLSPEPASGKSRALEVTKPLVPRPVESVSATSAYLFRKVGGPEGLPTILYDEIDTIFGPRSRDHEDVRAMINAGHRRNATAGRCVTRGTIIETEELPAYCAIALAGLGDLPDTILSRSILIPMRRRLPNEEVEPYRSRQHDQEGKRIFDVLSEWTSSVSFNLPELPEEIQDRNADIWEPLLMVADAAGGQWPKKARVAAVALVAASTHNTPSLGLRLLSDIRNVFMGDDLVPTTDLIKRLIALDEAPWSDLRGKPLTPNYLSQQLKPFGVTSKNVRTNESVLKGYTREGFAEAWSRYLPPLKGTSSPIAATAATSEKCQRCDGEGCRYCSQKPM